MDNRTTDLGRTLELTYFNTILNFAQVLNQETLEKDRNKRLDELEEKINYLILLLEKSNNE